MSWEQSVKLVCPVCLSPGEFVYDRQDDPYQRGQVLFKSLTRGFTYRSSGNIESVVIMCQRCHVKVNQDIER
jgi:hypothetical protein